MNKKNILVTIFFVTFYQYSFAQFTDTYWKLGRHAGLDFSSGAPIPVLTDNCINPLNNTSTQICDRNGQVLFYSNGLLVHNKLDGIMPNGDSLNNGTVSNTYYSFYPPWKAAVMIPFPTDSNKFYMFYVNLEWSIDGNYLPEKLYYLVIDKTLQGGLGDVTLKDQIVIQHDTLSDGEVMAVKHGNGKDWWIICRKYKSNRYYKILVDSSGVHNPIAQNIGIPYTEYEAFVGVCNQTLDGETMVFTYESFDVSTHFHPGQVDIVGFDRCTGLLNNYRQLYFPNITDTITWNVSCFSPSGRFLYLHDGHKLWQLDLTASNLMSSAIHVGTYMGSNVFFAMKIGPDNKIYIGPYGSSRYVHVINNPDVLGVGCNLQLNVIDFGGNGSWADGGMPNVPNFALGAIAPCGNVGVDDVKEEGQLVVYPNPVSNQLTVNSNKFAVNTIEVTDLLGRIQNVKVEKLTTDNCQLNTENLPSGIYFIKATDVNGNVMNGKFVKE